MAIIGINHPTYRIYIYVCVCVCVCVYKINRLTVPSEGFIKRLMNEIGVIYFFKTGMRS